MSRYIDADALKKDVEEFPNCYNGWSDTYDKAFIIGAIEEQPSIDIVRCKECKYHNGEYCFRLVSKDAWKVIGSQCVITMQPNEFCSCGEREGE